jgi:hypothetical protein
MEAKLLQRNLVALEGTSPSFFPYQGNVLILNYRAIEFLHIKKY